MLITRCRLILHDTVFFATREMGTLYETERFFHNYALSYALFNDAILRVPYFWASYRPRYAEDMAKLNERGIYVTPARPVRWDFLLITWKMGQVTYYRKPEKFGGKNYPANFGRAKELAPESEFEFFVIHKEPITLPRWIRLGKWASKALMEPEKSVQVEIKHGEFVSTGPLNPLDLPHTLTVYDMISMPPVSLVNNARLDGDHYALDEKTKIPAGMKYTFPS
jgi:CRISPR-associated protein Csc1